MLKASIAAGDILTCVSREQPGSQSRASQQAFAIIDVVGFSMITGEHVKLVKIAGPIGKDDGYKGLWSHEGEAWNDVSDETKRQELADKARKLMDSCEVMAPRILAILDQQ